MDDLDIKILKELNRDARESFREIAKKLSVSPGTVYNRVEAMEKGKVIKGYAPLIDAEKVGYGLIAVVSVRISQGKSLEVEKEIAKDDRCFACYDITGNWDSLVMGRFKDQADLDDFVKWVQTLKKVERTRTQIVLNTVKEERRVEPVSPRR